MRYYQKLSWQGIKLLIRWQFPEIQQLSTQDLAAWLEKDKLKPLLLDARTEQEYQVSHLQDAQLASRKLKNLIDRREVNSATPIVVYCSVGYRSAKIVRQLQSRGYSKAFNLSGSIFQWVNENRLVYQKNQPVKMIHPYQKFWQYLICNQSIKINFKP
ncbi:MAG: rhodanese-like domain-containing protein [Cyanobacteria bacterium J06648_1]